MVYNYRFIWIDENGKHQRFYIEANSEKDAISDFEETKGKTMDEMKATVRRMVR